MSINMKISGITTAAVAAFAFFSHEAAAAPNVTAVPIGTACTSYPGYDGRDAGPFIAIADSTGRAVDGIGLNAAYFVDGSRRYGYVSKDSSFNPAQPSPTVSPQRRSLGDK